MHDSGPLLVPLQRYSETLAGRSTGLTREVQPRGAAILDQRGLMLVRRLIETYDENPAFLANFTGRVSDVVNPSFR